MDEKKRKGLERDLRRRIRGDVSFDDVMRGIYATDASHYQVLPAGLVVPRDEEDVRAAIECAGEYEIGIVPRGGGTSLAGQAIGPCLIIDFSKWMDRIIELDVDGRCARVQPGIVLDVLNAALSPHRLHFAIDPATSSRATIGGMIGNNSSGTRSIVYGITRDHVLETRVILSDGTTLDFRELSPEDYDRRARDGDGGGGEARILHGFREIIREDREEIAARFPKVMRRVQGYNLDAFIATDRFNLSKLMVGSEGTLGIVLEAKLNLEPLPKHRALCTPHFTEILDGIRAVAPILEHGPSAVEIMDDDIIERARKNLSAAPLCGFMQGEPQAILVVEFFGETRDEAEEKARSLAADLRARSLGYAWPVMAEPREQARVWAVRKAGFGLMLGMKGDRKPASFIEDACVPIPALPEYIDRILRFCRGRGVPVAMYAHASVGVIHVQPCLDLKRREDIENLSAIAEFAFTLVQEYGGSWSGEHGDGRVRSPFLERFYGPRIYDAFRRVKRLFDSAGRMNPGVIIDPAPIDRDLRYGTSYKTPSDPTAYHFREDGSFAGAVELCTGVGECRQTLIGAMCPSFRATRDEDCSTRGRANALRLAMSGQLGPDGMTGRRLFEVMDLCLSCKACKAECPTNVDMARLKGEFLRRYREVHGTSLRERIIAGSARTASRIAGWKAPLINRIQGTGVFRKMLEKIAGFDSRRRLPAYARVPLATWFSRRPVSHIPRSGKVVLFDDTYMSYHETRVGISAVELLESCGYEVILARAGCCQRPRITHGFLCEAKEEGEKTLRNLDAHIRQGLKIVVCEPGCASALTDDLPDLIDDEGLGRRVKENVFMIDMFLAREIREGRLACEFSSPFERILIHGHCHQRSLYGTTAMKEVLDRIAGLAVAEISAGCCGMAGSFGYEREHYDLSMRIGEDRLLPAIRGRPEGAAVVACGFSCRHQIEHATGVKALHWVETLRGQRTGAPQSRASETRRGS